MRLAGHRHQLARRRHAARQRKLVRRSAPATAAPPLSLPLALPLPLPLVARCAWSARLSSAELQQLGGAERPRCLHL